MEDNLKVIYIKYVGQDSEGFNIYHFLLDEDTDKTWGEEWNSIPACNCNNLQPEDDMYSYVKELKTDIVLDLAQDQCCFSMGDMKEHIVAMAYENINDYEEYPDHRIVILFGENINSVEDKLSLRDLSLKFI